MDATIDKVGSHHVSLDYYGDMNKEELYPWLDVDFRGKPRRVQVSADRYTASSGLVDWRVYVREINPADGVGDKGRAMIRDTVVPMVEAWLASDEYAESRRQAFAYAIAREIRNTNTSSDYRARCALDKSGHEVSPADLERLNRALDMRMESLHLLDLSPIGA